MFKLLQYVEYVCSRYNFQKQEFRFYKRQKRIIGRKVSVGAIIYLSG